MATWPPTLAQLKVDMKIDASDNRENERLTLDLNAAIAKVQQVRGGSFKFDPTDGDQMQLPDPTDDLVLGTLRLAARWNLRRRSADGIVAVAAEMGSNRVPSYDNDIDRLLGIGKFRGSVIA